MVVHEDDADRRLVDGFRLAYEAAADRWAAGPAAVYGRLAAALLATSPQSLAGHRVLDVGAGTGVASDVLTAVGARPVGLDLSLAMLTYRRAHRPPGVVGDARALPFRAGAFDTVVAAFSLNHVPDPTGALGECRRVTRAGGVVLASSFPSDADHPAKASVEAVLVEFGYRRPEWYRTFKEEVAARTGDVDVLAQAAAAAGLVDVRVEQLDVDAGLDDPDVAVAWRLNMPHTIGFVVDLAIPDREELRARATAALRGGLPSSLPMLALRGVAP